MDQFKIEITKIHISYYFDRLFFYYFKILLKLIITKLLSYLNKDLWEINPRFLSINLISHPAIQLEQFF
jgi:hypothetical protein